MSEDKAIHSDSTVFNRRGTWIFGIPLLFFMTFLPPSGSLYFQLNRFEKKCFIQEAFDLEELVIGYYRTELLDPENGVQISNSVSGIHVEVFDKRGRLILSKQYNSEGRFSFHPPEIGSHSICLRPNFTRMESFKKMKVHFTLKRQDNTFDIDMLNRRQNTYTELETKALTLQLRLHDVLRSQVDRRVNEEMFRAISEKTNARVFHWVIAQVSVVLMVGVWQVKYLKEFFRAKKVV